MSDPQQKPQSTLWKKFFLFLIIASGTTAFLLSHLSNQNKFHQINQSMQMQSFAISSQIKNLRAQMQKMQNETKQSEQNSHNKLSSIYETIVQLESALEAKTTLIEESEAKIEEDLSLLQITLKTLKIIDNDELLPEEKIEIIESISTLTKTYPILHQKISECMEIIRSKLPEKRDVIISILYNEQILERSYLHDSIKVFRTNQPLVQNCMDGLLEGKLRLTQQLLEETQDPCWLDAIQKLEKKIKFEDNIKYVHDQSLNMVQKEIKSNKRRKLFEIAKPLLMQSTLQPEETISNINIILDFADNSSIKIPISSIKESAKYTKENIALMKSKSQLRNDFMQISFAPCKNNFAEGIIVCKEKKDSVLMLESKIREGNVAEAISFLENSDKIIDDIQIQKWLRDARLHYAIKRNIKQMKQNLILTMLSGI